MARMIDDIASNGFESYSFTDRRVIKGLPSLTEQILNAEVFTIDNIVDYYNAADDNKHWELKDFPNLAPPYPDTWLEFRFPFRMRDNIRRRALEEAEAAGYSREEAEKIIADIGYAGGVLLSYDEYPPDAPVPLCAGLPNTWMETTSQYVFTAGEIRWIMRCLIFIQMRKHERPMFTCFLQTGIQNDGAIHPAHKFIGKMLLPDEEFSIANVSEDQRLAATMQTFGFPALLGVTFLHCRNVAIDTNPPPPKVNAKYKRRNGRDIVTFKTLRIEPMQRILREAGAEDEGTGLRRALHTVRGHFKYYGERYGTKPLFGKHEGAYFWHQTLRGTSKQGAVVKDYEVRPERKESTDGR